MSAGRVLAIDYGVRRIGLALSDELRVTVRPLPVLRERDDAARLRRIAGLVEEEGVEEIVVGLPLNMDGTEGAAAGSARRFAELVARATGRPVTLVDERLTSWEAERLLIERGERRAARRRKVDGIAAALILEDFLAAGGRK
jgi:putative Holliday junction resolvase